MGLRDSLLGVGYTARISVATLADALVDRFSMDRSDERLAWWARKLLDSAEVSLEIQGAEHVPPGPLVLMSNHRSYYDIPTVFCAVPGRVRMVAKKELFRVPIFGPALLKSGFVKVDREKRDAAIASLKQSEELLQGGTRVWIAPEGTRSRDGRLGPFKSGGFHLALAAQVPILPIAIEGTQEILPHDGFLVRKGAHVTATILPSIDARAYGPARRKELMHDVRAAIAGALGEPA